MNADAECWAAAHPSQLAFLWDAEPGESFTYSPRPDRALITRIITAIEAEPDTSADDARHVVCATITTRYYGRRGYVSRALEYCYVSTLTTDDRLAVTDHGNGSGTIAGGVFPGYGQRVGMVEGVPIFTAAGIRAAHDAALAAVGPALL